MAVASSGSRIGPARLIARLGSLAWHQLANLLTLARIAAVVPIALCLEAGAADLAALLFILAAATDAVDGLVAKHLAGRSPVGAVLDPIADKLLIGTLALLLGSHGLLPIWLVVAIVLRDVVIVTGLLVLRSQLVRVRIEPLIIGKVSTLCQLSLLGAVLLSHANGDALAWAIAVLVPLTGALTIASLLAYAALAWRLYRRDRAAA